MTPTSDRAERLARRIAEAVIEASVNIRRPDHAALPFATLLVEAEEGLREQQEVHFKLSNQGAPGRCDCGCGWPCEYETRLRALLSRIKEVVEHVYYTHRPLEWDVFLRDAWGDETYTELRRKALRNEKQDMPAVVASLRSELARTEGQA